MKIKLILVTVALIVLGWLSASSVIAADLTLTEAKQQGLVGEQYGGYLGVVGGASSAVQSLIANVNSERRAHYERIAKSHQISVADVEALAGQKAIQKTEAGHYIQLPDQDWMKK